MSTDQPKRRFLIGIIVAGLLLLAGVVSLAQSVSPAEAMRAGNQSYEAGQYQEAIDIYESMVAAGIQDSALFYNLGNAYFKRGDLGRAILNYRKAQFLDPRDGDIVANLTIARAQTLDRLEADDNPLANLVELAEEWLTLTEAAVLALILWLLISLCLIVAILSRRFRRASLWTAGVVGLFLIVGLLSMANRYYVRQTSPPAVLVAPEVDVTSGPGGADQYLVEFNLHAGAEVQLLESRPDWRRIALPGNDFQGWVPADSVEPVIGP